MITPMMIAQIIASVSVVMDNIWQPDWDTQGVCKVLAALMRSMKLALCVSVRICKGNME